MCIIGRVWAQLMRDALAHALTQRTAVHLAIPEDIQQAMLQPEQQLQAQGLLPALRALHATPASGEAIRQAVEFLTKRKRARMLIAIGHLAVEEGPQITALAEQLNAPMVTRLDAKGTVDESHPLCLGVVGVHGNPGLEVSRDIVESADIIISCGVEDQMLVCPEPHLQQTH
jgi:acetolactate synthase-1/2/3 large subunit